MYQIYCKGFVSLLQDQTFNNKLKVLKHVLNIIIQCQMCFAVCIKQFRSHNIPLTVYLFC